MDRSTASTLRRLLCFPVRRRNIDIVRPVGRTITGRTLDWAGNPLGDCSVDLWRRDGKNREGFDTQQSQPDGTFRFDNLPAADLELSAHHTTNLYGGPNIFVQHDDFGSATVKADKTTVVIWACGPRRT